jgi:hypothetical protein
MENNLETMDLFKKFKLVPVGSTAAPMSNVEKAEQQLRNYNPSLRAMANNYTAMNDALHGRKRGRTAKSRLNLLNANRARLQYIQNLATFPTDISSVQDVDNLQDEAPKKRRSRTSKKKIQSAFTDQSESILETPLATPAKSNRKFDFDGLVAQARRAIPKNRQNDFDDLVAETSGALRPGNRGEMVIQNKSVPATSYAAVMRAMLVNTRGTSTPAGLKEAVSELKRIGVSDKILNTRRARRLYQFADTDTSQTGSGRSRVKKKKKKKLVCKVLRLY